MKATQNGYFMEAEIEKDRYNVPFGGRGIPNGCAGANIHSAMDGTWRLRKGAATVAKLASPNVGGVHLVWRGWFFSECRRLALTSGG